MKRDREHKKTGLHLKKTHSAKGKRNGVFYIASNSSGSDAMIVARLADDEAKADQAIKIGN